MCTFSNWHHIFLCLGEEASQTSRYDVFVREPMKVLPDNYQVVVLIILVLKMVCLGLVLLSKLLSCIVLALLL